MSHVWSDQGRLLALIVTCAVLWSVESFAPLYWYEKHRFSRALPNIMLAAVLVLTNFALSFATAIIAEFAVSNRIGLLCLLDIPSWVAIVIGVMALDLFTYFAHVLMHKSWLGWQFHRVHHSDMEVNVTTTFRQHPGETGWRILWYLLAIAAFGIPFSVVVIYLVVSTVNAQLEHTNIKVFPALDRVLRFVFVTPNMHKVHHSREQIETDTNYSNIFSIWDRVFGTYTPTVDFSCLRYGLDGFDDPEKQTTGALLKLPFVK